MAANNNVFSDGPENLGRSRAVSALSADKSYLKDPKGDNRKILGETEDLIDEFSGAYKIDLNKTDNPKIRRKIQNEIERILNLTPDTYELD